MTAPVAPRPEPGIAEVTPDPDELRRARRAAALAEMARDDLDIVLLGREGNARYVSGTRRLWTAGSRPFTPGCIVVRATGAVHLLSTWDEGMPDDIPHERLYGITFNPMNMVEVLRALPGAATARRVGTDSLTPMFAQLLPMAFPAAQIVDAEPALRRARRRKGPAEVEAIARAVTIAGRSLDAARQRLAPGATVREVTAGFMEAMADAGVTTPSSQDITWVASPTAPWERQDRDLPLTAGTPVVLAGGVVHDGYVGELGTTEVVGGGRSTLCDELTDLRRRLVAAARPGEPLQALLDAYRAGGGTAAPVPVARGLGLGFDLPIVSHELTETAAAEQLEPGTVVALTSYVWRPGVGGALAIDPVHITERGPRPLDEELL